MADADQQSSKQPPWHQEQDLEKVSFGTWLRRHREARGIELREIADHTKISIRYLEALEKDRFDLLPAPVFRKGFLSQYGRYIGLDPDQVVNTYLNALQEGDPSKTEEPTTGDGAGSRSLIAVLIVFAVLVFLALVGYLTIWRPRDDGARSQEPPPMAVPARIPVLAAVEEAVPSPEEKPVMAPLVVTLDFVDDSWLETVVDGERQLSEQVGKGESRRILAQQVIVLSLGNAPGVRVEVNGMPYDLPPSDGQTGVQKIEIGLPMARELGNEGAP